MIENKKHDLRRWTEDNVQWHMYAKRVIIGFGCLLVAFVFMPWMQTVDGRGRVIALNAEERRQELSAPVDGRIHKWLVNEGDSVKKGDPLVEMLDNDPLILDRMNKERDALEKKFQSLEVSRKTSALNVDRQRKLLEEGLSSRRQFELAKMELAKMESEEASALADLSKIDVRLSRQEQQSINAPMDGKVVRILKNSAGLEYISAGEPLAIIAPQTTARAVEVWISGNDMPWVQEGKRVALQFEGWPAVLFSGIPDTSVGVFFGKVHLVDALDDGQGRFRILVVPENENLWPSTEYLRQGVRAMATILLDNVPLGYEIWRRFNGLPYSNPPTYIEAEKGAIQKSDKQVETK